jgi:hypothetical protein
MAIPDFTSGGFRSSLLHTVNYPRQALFLKAAPQGSPSPAMEAARPVVIFVSGPNWGSLTGAAPFDQNVFENGLRIADMREDFEVGYDQAGSSSADPRDYGPGQCTEVL